MAVFERHGIRSAERAYWYEAGTLNGLLHNNLPTSSYWTYKWYGDQSGNIVRTVPGSWLDGVASYDTTRKIVNVVFGGDSGNNTVRVTGLGAPGSQVRATVVRSGTTARFTNQSAPIAVSAETYTVSGGAISVPVTGMDAADSYQLLVTPTSGVPTWQQRYETENATVVNANRFSAGSASHGGYVGRIDGSANLPSRQCRARTGPVLALGAMALLGLCATSVQGPGPLLSPWARWRRRDVAVVRIRTHLSHRPLHLRADQPRPCDRFAPLPFTALCRCVPTRRP